MNKWEKNLLNRSKLWKGQFIPVHAISSFIYCKKDPERFLQNLKKEATLGMLNGTKNHEEIEKECVRIRVRQMIKAIITKNHPVSFREFPLISKYNGYLVAGVLDEIMFTASKPILLKDDKFPTSLRNFESLPYPSQEAQLLLYGFLLERTGFNIEDLIILLVKHYDNQKREFEVAYNKEKVEDILTSCETVQKLYYSVLPNY